MSAADIELWKMFGLGVLVGLQASLGIFTTISWRRTDQACLVKEMLKARREKRRIIGWTKDGAPILDARGTAPREGGAA